MQKTAKGIIFPCFLYEEAVLKTSLVTLSDQSKPVSENPTKQRLQA